MTKFKLLVCSIASAFFLNGCSQVLESVLLLDGTKSVKASPNQEEFNINIKSLTFKNARRANNDPYPRQLMQTGIGNKANVFDEADFLDPKIPPLSNDTEYRLGIGDILSFQQLNEFAKFEADFPVEIINGDYLLGVGDELTLMQLSQNNSGTSENILSTAGIVGTNGNILLLGLGSIKAKDRSLNSIQTEIRNILIRNGLAPNFQLEITGFNSKKAFVTFKGLSNGFGQNVINITNLPITLKEVILNYGFQPSSPEILVATLKRNGRNFRMTAGQIFEKSAPLVIIEDGDQIEISQAGSSLSSPISLAIGSNGKIILPNIGNIKVENMTLAELQTVIANTLLKQGMVPSFQLEITGFNSKRFFLIVPGQHSRVLTLTNYELDLKEAVLNAGLGNNTEFTTVNLARAGSNYQMTFQDMLNNYGSKVMIQDGDTIELKGFAYKPGQVFALGGAGSAQMVTIHPSKRETLADILFTPNGALNNLLAKRSEVYLLRGQKPSVAYHLDAQNVSRILVAAETELRPNDIVYVADRPIISFSRTLSEILPLRILLRDIQDNNIP
jgi:protein involved in polysaccharide export with SLBB domain